VLGTTPQPNKLYENYKISKVYGNWGAWLAESEEHVT